MSDDSPVFDMSAARRRWAEKEAIQRPSKAKGRRQALVGAVDKRSLRKTGRTIQYNLRVREGWKEEVSAHATRLGYGTAIEFLEAAVAAYVEAGAKE